MKTPYRPVIDHDLVEDLHKMAEEEHRTPQNMVNVLLRKAVDARQSRTGTEPDTAQG